MTQPQRTPDLDLAIPSECELVSRARDMIPMLIEKATSVEANRKVPAETIQAFVDAGFFKILQPRRFGGWEMNPKAFYKVLMELGRGCGASAWNMMILGVHQWEFGILDARAGEDVWGKDDTVIVGSCYPPMGVLEIVEGGYKLSGTWRPSSGCDHAQWSFMGALVKDEAGQVVDRLSLLVPASDYRIVDDWHVFGLKGTGSKTLVIDDTFVPAYRAHSMVEYSAGERPAPYLLPFNQVFFAAVSAQMIGMGQGAIDEYIEQMQSRRNTATGELTALNHYTKDRLGNAVVRVRSARARVLQMMDDTMDYAIRGELVPESERVAHMLDIARAGRDCEEAVTLLFKAVGARGIYEQNALQRWLRDIIAGANHITQNADDSAGVLGGYLLGQPLPPLMFNLA